MFDIFSHIVAWLLGKLFSSKEPSLASISVDATKAHDDLAQEEAANAIQRTSGAAASDASDRIVRAVTDAPSHDDATVNAELRKQFPSQFRD